MKQYIALVAVVATILAISVVQSAYVLVLLVLFSTTIVQIAIAQGNLSVVRSSNTTFGPAAVNGVLQS